MPLVQFESRVSFQEFVEVFGGVCGYEVLPLLVVSIDRKDVILVRPEPRFHSEHERRVVKDVPPHPLASLRFVESTISKYSAT
jgi:hypothetical protein